jgi:hypothetical protein
VPYKGKLQPVDVGDSIELNGVSLTAIAAQHGPIEFNILGVKRKMIPGPDERAGFGSIGSKFRLGSSHLSM